MSQNPAIYNWVASHPYVNWIAIGVVLGSALVLLVLVKRWGPKQ